MALHIRDARAYALARELADLNGTTITAAVISALEDALRARKKRERPSEIVDETHKKSGISLAEAASKPL